MKFPDLFGGVHSHVVPGPGNAYRPHLLRRRALLLLLGIALAAEALLVANLSLRQAGLPYLAAVVQSAIIGYTNEARAALGGAPLAESPLLTAAAHAKAADMAEKGYFSHNGPDGKTPWEWVRQVGYDYQYAGENLAVRFVDSKDVVDAWMASPGHRANIVRPAYTEIGVGIARGIYKGQPADFVVQYFGTPAFAPAGAAVVTGDGLFNPLMRQMGQYFADPRASAAWALALVAAVLAAVMGVTLARHIQIQPLHALAPGAAVLAVAAGLLIINSAALGPQPAASVGSAIEVGTAAFAERP